MFKRIFERFIKIRGNPKAIAFGFGLGVFVGMTPSMGVQIILVLFIAALLKWNKIAATLGVFVTNPLTAPFIYSSTYIIGAKILGLRNGFQMPDEMSVNAVLSLFKNAPGILGALTIGGLITGIPLGIIASVLSYFIIIRFRNRNKLKKLKLSKQRSGYDKSRPEKKTTRYPYQKKPMTK